MRSAFALLSGIALSRAAELRGSAEALDQHGAVVVTPPHPMMADVSLESGAQKPNILMILVDDQGHGDIDLGTDKSEFHTPTISELAGGGVKLQNFYSAATCTPARAMLMTGRYTIRYGFQDSVIHATEPRGVPLTETFLSEKLKKVGYTTVMIGKWHLGMHTDAYVPLSRGFDFHYGILTGGGSHTKHISVSGQVIARGQTDKHTFTGLNLWDNGKFSVDNTATSHSTVLYTKRAMDTIQHFAASGTDPWFVLLSYQAIHDPIEVGDEAFITETKCNAIDETLTNRRIMCGMMAEVDDGLKQIHTQLVSLKVWDRTVIVYASDNGGLLDHGSSNAPFRGEKGMYYEGGVHVPAFFSGGFLARQLAAKGVEPFTLSGLAHITDLHTTMLALAGYDYVFEESAAGVKLDGMDLWAQLFGGAEATARSEVLINANSELFGSSGALRVGDYKVLVNPDPQESTIYMQVKAHIQTQSTEVAPSELAEFAAKQTKNVLENKKYIFNVVRNPTEQDLGEACEVKEECSNLAEVAEFDQLSASLMKRFEEYRKASAPSSFAWQDDGAIANPMFFSNLWTPWRDLNGDPKVVYEGLARAASLATASASASGAAATSLAALTVASAGGSEVVTALVSGAAVIALIAGVAYKAGQKSMN